MYGYAMNCGCSPRQGRRGGVRNAAWPVQAWAAQQLQQAAKQAVRVAQSAGSTADGAWMPAVDIREDAQAYYLSADLPGVNREDIHVELEEGKLTLSAERQPAKTGEGTEVRWQGRRYGSFRRSFNLPRTVDADAISAEYKDGVLHVTLPKSEVPTARQVNIN
jgi:HSP20 family protein